MQSVFNNGNRPFLDFVRDFNCFHTSAVIIRKKKNCLTVRKDMHLIKTNKICLTKLKLFCNLMYLINKIVIPK